MNPPVYTSPEDGLTVVAEPTPEDVVRTVDDVIVNPYQRVVLFALNRQGKHVYAGTVPAAEKARRRAANRAARKTRQAQRRAA